MPYSLKEAGKYLGLSRAAVVHRIKKGILKARRRKTETFVYEIDEKSLMENLAMGGRWAVRRTRDD